MRPYNRSGFGLPGQSLQRLTGRLLSVSALPNGPSLRFPRHSGDGLSHLTGAGKASLRGFIRVFKATLEFAKLTPGAYTGATEHAKSTITVGDFVQWESQGVLQFEAKKVVAITPDRLYVQVEGSQTGIPMEQVSKVDPPSQHILGAHITTGVQMFPPSVSNTGGISVKAGLSIAREIWAIDEGEAMLVFPSAISAQSVEDIEAWLKLVVTKLKRRSGAPSQTTDGGSQ